MDGMNATIELVGKLVSNLGLPIVLIGAMVLGVFWGAPWAGAMITRIVDAFTKFLDRLNTAHEDMSKAVEKLADNTEHVPEIKATLARVETKVDGLKKT